MSGGPDNPETTVLLSIGSNLGRREETVLEAVARLARCEGLSLAAVSSLYETEPVGFAASRPFINAACAVTTAREPREILALCLRIERELGRRRPASMRDRTIDIDILACGRRVVNEADLVIPHPRLRERLFALVPLEEISPSFALPPDGRTVGEIRRSLAATAWTVRVSSRGEIR